MHTSRKLAPGTISASALCVSMGRRCKARISTPQWRKAGVPFSCVALTNMDEHMEISPAVRRLLLGVLANGGDEFRGKCHVLDTDHKFCTK